MWPDRRIIELFGIAHPILQAPMAGAQKAEMSIAVTRAGGLGALPCALLNAGQADAEIGKIDAADARPFNLNFFCHMSPQPDPADLARWHRHLRPYYEEFGLDADATPPQSNRAPFDDAFCAIVERHRPEVVSFHFGLPEPALLDRVKATGARVIGSATTVREALWLAERGCDAIIAQGAEAGGHRGMFLTTDIATQVGTFALVPQVADAVDLPVIAAGGIADGRGIVAALALGASAVQVGSAFLRSPQASIAPLHRQVLEQVRDEDTVLTNVFTGRPARGILNRVMREVGPVSDMAPPFPLAGGALAPLRNAAEPKGDAGFQSLWAGQAAALARAEDAGEITRRLVEEALALLGKS
jgi:nitronate monooxygenase